MLNRTSKAVRICVAAALFAVASATAAAAPSSPLLGYWACTGQNGGLTFESTFDYRADGTYVSTQRISAGGDFIEGGGGGTWRLDGDVLYDTKLHGRLDRYVEDGVDVPSSSPAYQRIVADSQANIGQTTSAQVRFSGTSMFVSIYACQRG